MRRLFFSLSPTYDGVLCRGQVHHHPQRKLLKRNCMTYVESKKKLRRQSKKTTRLKKPAFSFVLRQFTQSHRFFRHFFQQTASEAFYFLIFFASIFENKIFKFRIIKSKPVKKVKVPSCTYNIPETFLISLEVLFVKMSVFLYMCEYYSGKMEQSQHNC